MPLLLPWLALMALLLLPANRTAQAWWVSLPVAVVTVANLVSVNWLTFVPSAARDMLGETLEALAFGVAALWLLGTYLARSGRVLGCVGIGVVLFLVSLGVFVVRQDVNSVRAVSEFAMFLLLASGTIAVALGLSAWASRPPHRLSSFVARLTACLAASWGLLAMPLLALFVVASGGHAPWTQLIVATSIAAGISYMALLPFLILSASHSWFDGRLRELLHLELPVQSGVLTNTEALQ